MPKYEAAAAEYTAEYEIDGGYVLGGDTLITEESVQIIFPLKELPPEEPDDPEIPEVDDREDAPAPDDVVPDANQYRYQKEELSAFCHFGPNTFNEIEWGEHYGNRHPSEIFTLTQDFDADTFVRTLKEAGFQKLIVTAKHHDGFCIWDSKWTEYMAILYNNTDNETWKLCVAEGSWAGNGKFVDSLNRGDRMESPTTQRLPAPTPLP